MLGSQNPTGRGSLAARLFEYWINFNVVLAVVSGIVMTLPAETWQPGELGHELFGQVFAAVSAITFTVWNGNGGTGADDLWGFPSSDF